MEALSPEGLEKGSMRTRSEGTNSRSYSLRCSRCTSESCGERIYRALRPLNCESRMVLGEMEGEKSTAYQHDNCEYGILTLRCRSEHD